jgi:hypothetical protein
MKPQVIFLVIDDFPSTAAMAVGLKKVAAIGNVNKGVRLNVIVMGDSAGVDPKGLDTLARDNFGTLYVIPENDRKQKVRSAPATNTVRD